MGEYAIRDEMEIVGETQGERVLALSAGEGYAAGSERAMHVFSGHAVLEHGEVGCANRHCVGVVSVVNWPRTVDIVCMAAGAS